MISTARSSRVLLVVLLVLVLQLGGSVAKEPTGSGALPGPVADVLEREFPGSEIRQVDAEKEGGVQVYDVEFRQGGIERECDIAADGTILETSAVVEAGTVPEVVLTAFKAAAAGGTVGKIAKAEIRFQAKGGKLAPLDPPKHEYEAEIERDGRHGEITVASDGTVVEGPKWFKGRSEESEEDEGDEGEKQTTGA